MSLPSKRVFSKDYNVAYFEVDFNTCNSESMMVTLIVCQQSAEEESSVHDDDLDSVKIMFRADYKGLNCK